MGKYKNNPWLGLESYQENQIIYGRNREIEELSQCVLNNNETVLYGKSGIGKSSIINAGILPVARANEYIPVVVRLDHSNKHSYIKQINDQICKFITIANCSSTKSIDEQLLWEYFHTREFKQTANTESKSKLLIVFDQFEEIFTLQENATVKNQFFKEIGDVLNDVMPKSLVIESKVEKPENTKQNTKETTQITGFSSMTDLFSSIATQVENANNQYIEDNDIHFVFTLREDFLSEFEYYTTRIPSLKQHRYGLRPINEEQAAEIIMKPRPDLVDEGVARLIIETVTNRTDFCLGDEPEIDVDAAVLSLFLSQIYDKRETEQDVISIELVKTFGKDIIKDFYEESIEGLSHDQIDFLEEELLTGENRRDSLSRSDFKAGGFTEEELKRLIDEKKLLRQFHYEGDLRVEFIHDVLCNVVKERKEKRLVQRQQEEEKRQLQEVAERRQRELEEKAARERARLEAEALKTKIRNRRIYVAAVSLLFAIGVGITYYYFANVYTYKSYYNDFARVNGWPVGIGHQLNTNERATTPLYYCLSHKGSSSPVLKMLGIRSEPDFNTDVEILSSNPTLPHSPRIKSFEIADIESRDAKAVAYNELLSSISKIHFVGGENNVIEKEVALNEKDSTLFIVNYFHINNSDMWGAFVTPNGQAMQIREKEGIDRMKISTDSIGRIRSLTYYDQNGVCQPINDGVCGYAWDYDSEEGIEKRYLLNQFSLPIDNNYNLVITKIINDTLVTKYRHVSSTDDEIGVEALGPEGFCNISTYKERSFMYISESSNNFSTKIIEKDSKGNVIREKIENNLSRSAPSLVKYRYNSLGELTKLEKLTDSGTPFYVNETDNYLYEWSYNEGKAVKEIRKNKYQITYQHFIEKKNNITRETTEDIYENKYVIKVDSTFNDGYSTSYFGRNNIPINWKVKIEEDSILFHRKRCLILGDKEYRYFYIYNEGEKRAPLIQNDYGKTLSYYSKVIKKDKDGNCISYKKLDENGVVIKSMMFFTLNGQIIGRAAEGVDNTPIRCNNWEEEGYLYYKIYYNKDFDDNFVGIHGLNEWGQTSTFFDPSVSKCLKVEYLDFMGHVIEDATSVYGDVKILRSYKQYVLENTDDITSFSYPYLHIIDKESDMYKMGFKDGDRIIKFGKWNIGDSISRLNAEWSSWINSNYYVEIEILRPLSNGLIDRIKKNLNNTQPSKKLQEYHLMPLTTGEFEYLKNKSLLK